MVVAVIVPAHDEASVIGACLDSLGGALGAPEVEVVVVCNGCSDSTAEVARQRRGVTVLELAEPSKAAALRAGSDAVSSFPRVVLDADVTLSEGALPRIAEVLESDRRDGQEGPLVATPRARFDTTGRPWAVRAFFEVHQRLPYLQEAPVGPGCFALSEAGWQRLGPFPDLTADDLWVQRHFSRSERTTVDDVTFTVQTPRSVRFLLRIRTRAYRGMLELDRVLPAMVESGRVAPGRVRAVLDLVRSPGDVPAVAAYSVINVVALARARRAERRGSATWERDDSSR